VAGRYTEGSNQGFKSPIYLKKHFNKHNAEFDPPFANEQEYEQAGIAFMSENGENVPDDVYQACFYRPNNPFHGDLVRYDEKRNLFGMKTSKGFLRTFYLPADGILEFFNTFVPRS
jgi:pyocin large subunit-like protein